MSSDKKEINKIHTTITLNIITKLIMSTIECIIYYYYYYLLYLFIIMCITFLAPMYFHLNFFYRYTLKDTKTTTLTTTNQQSFGMEINGNGRG